MTMASETLQPSEALIAENANVLRQFEKDGVDLAKRTEFEFVCDFSTKEQAHECRRRLREVLPQLTEITACDDAMFIVVVLEENFELKLSARLQPDSEKISYLEKAFAMAASDLTSEPISWMFANSENAHVL